MKFFYKSAVIVILFALLAIPDNRSSLHVPDSDELNMTSKWWGKFAQNLVKYRITNKQNQEYEYNKHQNLLHKHLDDLLIDLTEPDDQILDSINFHINKLSALVSLLPEHIEEFENDVAIWRKLLKYQSRYWNTTSKNANERLFKLLIEGRLAFESALIQSQEETAYWQTPKDSVSNEAYSFHNLNYRSGDIVAFSLNPTKDSYLSVFKELPNIHQHLGSIFIKNNEAFIVYLDRVEGLITVKASDFIGKIAPNGIILRLREDIPSILRNPALPTLAASTMYNMAKSGQYRYDYNYDTESHSFIYDWEFISKAFGEQGLDLTENLWERTTYSINVGTHKEHLLPFEVELDHRFVVAGEWYHSEFLYQNRLLSAATSAIMKYHTHDKFVNYFKLPFYRFLKAYSGLIGYFDIQQPIPSGVSAQTQLVYNSLVKKQLKLVDELSVALLKYEEKQQHRATYLKMLQKADEIMRAQTID